MKIVAIIQARLGSTRLPGKVLKDIGGRTMLARVVRRVRRAATLDDVIVATTTEPADSAIVEECARLGVHCFRGSELDVLDRYCQAAKQLNADAVVRITSDCPLIDPGVIDSVVAVFRNETPDYASNVVERTYPRGLDTEVVSMDALTRAWQEARQHYERVHVTPYFYRNPELFRMRSVVTDRNHSGFRWTVDTAEDLAFICSIYEALGPDDLFDWKSVLCLLSKEPELATANSGIRQKSLEEA